MDIQNEVQDFSVKKSTAAQGISKSGNKLDDTLSKLMKRKNCPEPEPLVGKEKKRRKLDEIVLGLSAAKEQSLFPEPSKKPTVTPSVTVTPTSAPVSTSHNISQKPFTITVTSVPSSAPSNKGNNIQNILPYVSSTSKDHFSTFLAQAEQQNLLLKKQQQQRKSYEAMIADMGKVADFSSKVNSYSHEAKVNKWLAEQNAALAEQPLSADYLSPRRRRPRVDPTLLDWKKLTGDENVAVIHRVTGKKLTGPKAPTLKRLGQWLMENPMYDIDPKWSELVKERGNLSHDLQKRLPGQSNSKCKSTAPGRPPLLASPTGSTSSVSSANLTTSLPTSMSFPSLSNSSLAGLNSNLLTGLSNLSQFDPKTNPLLMPFAGLPNMGGLGSMGGLGNLTNMNLFANLASLGLPGLSGIDTATIGNTSGEATKISSKSSTNSSKQKHQDTHNSSKNQLSSSTSIPTTNPFPFFFPNPSLLYTPLGLGGLNPFTLQTGMSAAYDSLAQQCGLLNGGLNQALSPNSNSKLSKSNISRTLSSTTTTTSSSQNKPPRSSNRDAHLQQLLLPPDTQILENISKAASLDISLKQSKNDKKEDKRKALESLRGILPTDFSSSIKDRKPGMPILADFTKLLEVQVSQSASKKAQELQMKEALEQFTKTNADLMAKALVEEQAKLISGKRIRDINELSEKQVDEEQQLPDQKVKESQEKSITPTLAFTPSPMANTRVINEQEGVDIETLLPPSTVVKSSSLSPEKTDVKEKSLESNKNEESESSEPFGSKVGK